MATLIMTVGLPRSGKSTYVRTRYPDVPRVCPDEIRKALHGQLFAKEAEPMVWAMAKIFVRSLFYAGHDRVVLDATNTTVARRDMWLSDYWARRFLVFPTLPSVCVERAKVMDAPAEYKQALIGVIEDMWRKYEMPDDLEVHPSSVKIVTDELAGKIAEAAERQYE